MAATRVRVTKSGQLLSVESPYSAQFVQCAHQLGGAFVDGLWQFAARDAEAVQNVIVDVYGGWEAPDELHDHTVRLKFADRLRACCRPVIIGGCVIASARGRDSGARPGAGVVYLDGGCTSGGSVKNWESIIQAGSVVEVRGVSLRHAGQIVADAGLYPTTLGLTAEVVPPDPPDETDAPVVVTRHPALADLLRELGVVGDDARVVAHATPDDIRGRRVVGVLPLSLAALAESITEVPVALGPEDRGRELSLDELRERAGQPATYKVLLVG